jgi:hypothetical protein
MEIFYGRQSLFKRFSMYKCPIKPTHLFSVLVIKTIVIIYDKVVGTNVHHTNRLLHQSTIKIKDIVHECKKLRHFRRGLKQNERKRRTLYNFLHEWTVSRSLILVECKNLHAMAQSHRSKA